MMRFLSVRLHHIIGALFIGVLVIHFAPYQQPALAITAEERLDDPAMEARARTIGRELRCLVCQNQSIDDRRRTAVIYANLSANVCRWR